MRYPTHPGVRSKGRRLAVRVRPRLFATAAAVTVTGLLASSCGSSSHGAATQANQGSASHPVTITFANWADAETATQPGIKAAISKFEATHPGIKIKEEPISFTDIGHELVLQVRSGNTPDVAEISGNDTYSVNEAGGLEPLTSYATSSYQSSIIPKELHQGEIGGKLVAIPWTDAPPALWYNKTIMSKAGLNPNDPPKTTSQLLSDMATIRNKEPKVVPLGLDTSNRDFALSSNWAWMKTFGTTPFSGSKATANTAGMRSYLTFMRELKHGNDIQPLKKIGDERPLAADGELAFTWDQPLLQGVIQSSNHMSNAAFYKTWGVAPLPTGTTGRPYSIELGHQLVMFKSSKYQADDWKFMNWLSTSSWSVANYTIKYESSLPPLAHPSAGASKLLDTPVYKAFSSKITPQIITPAYGPTFEEAYPPIMSGVESAVTSSTPVTKIVSSMQSGLGTAFG